MATADIEEYLSERDLGHTLFSNQYCRQPIIKTVKIESVVQKFIDSKIISEAERKSLSDEKVPDKKFRHLLTIITDHCNRNDLQAFKTFIDILVDTNNVDMAQQLSPIYNERVHSAEIRNELLKANSLIGNLENEKSRLERILKEKEGYIESLTDEKLDNQYRKVGKQIKKKEEDLLFVEQKFAELTRTKNVLENEVKVKSNDIRKREEKIVEKERKVREAIEECNRLRLKVDLHQQQHSTAMVKDREELSNEIEILKDKIAEKENTIMDLRKNKTMTRKEIEEELVIITRGQEKSLNVQTGKIKQQKEEIDSVKGAQMALIKQPNEKIDDKEAIIKQQKKKIDDQEAKIKQQNEKIDVQEAKIKQQNEKFDDQMAMIQQQNEKIDDQMAMIQQQNEKINDQMAMIQQQNEKTAAIMRALCLQEKK